MQDSPETLALVRKTAGIAATGGAVHQNHGQPYCNLIAIAPPTT